MQCPPGHTSSLWSSLPQPEASSASGIKAQRVGVVPPVRQGVVLGCLHHWHLDFYCWPVGLLIKWGFCFWASPKSGHWSGLALPLEPNQNCWRHFHEPPTYSSKLPRPPPPCSRPLLHSCSPSLSLTLMFACSLSLAVPFPDLCT